MKSIITGLFLVAGITVAAADFTAVEGAWELSLPESTRQLSIRCNGKELFNSTYASVTYNKVGEDTELTIAADGSIVPVITKESIEDCFGEGVSYIFTYRQDNGIFAQRFNFYPSKEYMIVSADISVEDGAEVETRRIIPLATTTSSRPFNGADNRTIWVPFDNDGHMKYENVRIGTDENISHEVTAIFDADTRYGLVAGSVDHDKWKSGVTVAGYNGYRLDKIELLSGLSNYFTRDVAPHGKVRGTNVSSARFMIGMFDDWREGFNTFGDANILVSPRAEWTGGNPMGWNSWGVMMNHITYDAVVESATWMKDNLYNFGFQNKDGRIVISLDSFASDNLGNAGIYKLGTKVLGEGSYRDGFATKQGLEMDLGQYCGPFVAWGWNFDGKISGTGLGGEPSYTWRDVLLLHNGEPIKVNSNGAYAVDPTHPAIRTHIKAFMKEFATNGCKYVKADFLNNGICEGDKWYNPEITTGVMAYNYGMQIFLEEAERYGMYLVESISPIFPYSYAHGRRQCCDRFSEMAESEYVMNAISYGWWTDRLYTVNDPDQLVLCKDGHNMQESLGENRARATTGMASGAFIFGDNFAVENKVTQRDQNASDFGREIGYPEESRVRALAVMANPDINAYVRENTGSFMPVEGNKPTTSVLTGNQSSEWLFVRHTSDASYLAVFNWNRTTSLKGSVSFERLGIDASSIGNIKELWLNEPVEYSDEEITYNVPRKDVRLYRISNASSSVDGIVSDRVENSIAAACISDGMCVAASNVDIESVSVYTIMGVWAGGRSDIGAPSVQFEFNARPGSVYIVDIKFTDGSGRTIKCIAH